MLTESTGVGLVARTRLRRFQVSQPHQSHTRRPRFQRRPPQPLPRRVNRLAGFGAAMTRRRRSTVRRQRQNNTQLHPHQRHQPLPLRRIRANQDPRSGGVCTGTGLACARSGRACWAAAQATTCRNICHAWDCIWDCLFWEELWRSQYTAAGWWVEWMDRTGFCIEHCSRSYHRYICMLLAAIFIWLAELTWGVCLH
jgi:hypothetical protein